MDEEFYQISSFLSSIVISVVSIAILLYSTRIVKNFEKNKMFSVTMFYTQPKGATYFKVLSLASFLIGINLGGIAICLLGGWEVPLILNLPIPDFAIFLALL